MNKKSMGKKSRKEVQQQEAGEDQIKKQIHHPSTCKRFLDEHKAKVTYHLLALQQPVGSEFTSANSASVGRHFVAFVTAMWLTARNTILTNWELCSQFCGRLLLSWMLGAVVYSQR